MTSIGDKYDSIARKFAETREKNLVEKKYLDLLISHLHPHSHILDVGCGTGEPIMAYLSNQGFILTGLDASKQLIKIAEKKFPTMKFIHGDMRIVSVQQKFNAIVLWDSVTYLPIEDQKYMFSRCASWLTTNGKLLFTTGDMDSTVIDHEMLGEKFSYYSYSPEGYKKLLEAAGFDVLFSEKDQEHHIVWLAEWKGI
jgi:cyclopropane fatty-acyl-phospholipid synthase-like methyltransferase